MNWLNLPKSKQQELFKQLSVKTGIQPQAIEKDAWVTLVLRIIFNSKISEHLVFKGGTSLSKAYQLIHRFSEDIDLAINREYLGFKGELTKGQIRKLRKKSHNFVSYEMLNIIINEFETQEIDKQLFNTTVRNTTISDQDPEIIEIKYQSVFGELPYIEQKVLIEIGARSLLEPSENKEIKSIIDENYADAHFSESHFTVRTILPDKTFLEKLILLHEEFTKPIEKIRYHRMSRHLYDIGEIITTDFGFKALIDKELFDEIISHRKIFTPVKSVNYDKLEIDNLIIIPPKEFFNKYENDYKEMQENMIYGKSMTFKSLIDKIKEILTARKPLV
jgi:predicted nucleotidyltransferase component of viral defense system